MIKALLLLLVIVIGFIAGPLLSGQTGYVLIAIAGYTIETSVVVFVLALLLCFLLLWLFDWVVRKLSSGARFSLDWSRKRKLRKADELMTSALENILTANYEVAQQNAEDAANYYSSKRQSLLVAAIAAELQNDALAKHTLINQAADENAGESLVKEVADAQREAPDTAVNHLRDLLAKHPQHAGIKRIAAQVFYQYDAGLALFELLPDLVKHQLLAAEQLLVYKAFAYQYYFGQAHNAESLHQRWKDLDKRRRQHSTARLSYASALQQKGQYEAAEKVLLKGLRKEHLTPSHLAHCQVPIAWRQQPQLYAFMQEYVKRSPNHIDALTILASMAIQQGDYELALSTARNAIQLQPSPERFRLLGDAYLAAGQTQPALDAYRQVVHK